MEKAINEKRNVALVSGGTRGIGRQICIKLAEEGFDLVFTFLSSEEAARELENELQQKYPDQLIQTHRCDMADQAQVKSLFAIIKKQYGHLDVLVNNAGVLGKAGPFMMTTDKQWWEVMHTNVSSVVNACRMALPLMLKKRKGHIINITSLSGQRGNPGQSAYAASKAAITAFSKSLLKEVGKGGININCVAPGLIETDMVKDVSKHYYADRIARSPLQRMGRPEEVANLVAYLAKEAPSYLIGQEITLDGGLAG